jgi:hypothetical protein
VLLRDGAGLVEQIRRLGSVKVWGAIREARKHRALRFINNARRGVRVFFPWWYMWFLRRADPHHEAHRFVNHARWARRIVTGIGFGFHVSAEPT